MLLECKNLCVGYTESEYVFKNINVQLDCGQTLAVTGINGAGKTTFINAIMGLLDTGCYISGKIHACGIEITQGDGDEMRNFRRSMVSLMPQDVAGSLNPLTKIGQQIRSAAVISGKYKKPDNFICCEILAKMGFENPAEIFKMYPHELSLGMAARCLLAMSLITKPSILILDEPTASLDRTLKNEIIDIITDYSLESGCGIIVVTHDESDLLNFNKLTVLNMGDKNDKNRRAVQKLRQ
ncbi:MAG: ATP-binding cassette domain-containing protein [Eubacteriales bacterium]|nr:ATP-binding cassette domain-containing protein [Eubacteriales bacterium]